MLIGGRIFLLAISLKNSELLSASLAIKFATTAAGMKLFSATTAPSGGGVRWQCMAAAAHDGGARRRAQRWLRGLINAYDRSNNNDGNNNYNFS